MESFQQIKNNNMDLISNNDPLDKNRLLIEDLWESVLREECPDDQAERLIQLKELSYSKQIDGDSSKTLKNEIVDIVNSMDLAESIAAARAFSLYFQLVNILELSPSSTIFPWFITSNLLQNLLAMPKSWVIKIIVKFIFS